MSNIVSLRQMKDGTRDDYLLLDESERDYARQVPLRQPFVHRRRQQKSGITIDRSKVAHRLPITCKGLT
jgi:hypothetical protein